MSGNNPFRQLNPSNPPPSPHLDNYHLEDSPPVHALTTEPESLYDEEPNQGEGYLAPSHELRSPSTPPGHSPPNFEAMPIPVSYLPPGAAPPQRFYGALGGDEPRMSITSSSYSLNDLPRPQYPYHDSDYNSVSRLRRDSHDARSLATFDTRPESRFAGGFGEYQDDMTRSTIMNEYQMEDFQQARAKNALYAAPKDQKRKRGRMLLIILGVLAALVAAGALGYYLLVVRKHSSGSGSSGGGSSDGGSSSSTSTAIGHHDLVVTGGDGSTVTMDDGTTFIYENPFGGTWYYDPNDPYNNNARAQSYTPPLNTTFKPGTHRIYGVNLGGWLNTEPFISPALYEPYLSAATPAIDEWTLSVNMAKDTARGGLNQLETHYATFITEKDFADIAGAGLNFVRIPIPYWAITKFDDEPFLSGAQWKYVVKAIGWARKYGLRINLDLHALPGSQNGFNHAGMLNAMNWMYGTMGIANAQRGLEVIRTIAEFISQPQYTSVVTMFGLVNEPQLYLLGQDVVGHFYYQAHNIIRNITGIGEGHGAWIVIHDGFNPTSNFTGYLEGSDRIALDTHPYLCFQPLLNEGPDAYAKQPCPTWAARINSSTGDFGFVHAGEWSLGYTDCGLYLNGVGQGTRYEANWTQQTNDKIGNCKDILQWPSWDSTYKNGLMAFARAQMDVLQNWFFWNWKIGNSSVTGKVESPHWSYQLGLQEGWLPSDPRSGAGTCAKQGIVSPLGKPLAGYQTGGPGAGTFLQPQVSSYGQWPPSSMSGVTAMSGLPVYVQTGTPITLTAPTPTTYAPSYSPTGTISVGNGWANPSDTVGAYVPIAGCAYPNAWSAVSSPYPQCTPSVQKRRKQNILGPSTTGSLSSTITPKPKL